MGSSDRLFNRQSTVHQILGGGLGLVIFLTIPAFYERNEDHIDRYVMMGYRKLHHMYVRFDVECVGKVRKWILEKKKLS